MVNINFQKIKKNLEQKVGKLYNIFFLLWSIQLVLLLMPLIIASHLTFFKTLVLVYSIICLIIAISLQKNKPLAIVFSKILIIIFWLIYGWKAIANFIYNNYMFIQGHELFIDSPATIIVVYINAIFGLFFPFILTILIVLSLRNKNLNPRN